MKIIALSGAIASGKNFIADILAQKLNCEIFDADLEVHKIYQEDTKIIKEVAKLLPKALQNNQINRQILAQEIIKNPKKLADLEQIIHPQIRKNYQDFLKQQKQESSKHIILNVPLLLEKKGYEYDELIAITIYPSVQKRRFIARAKKRGQTDLKYLEKKFRDIKSRQLTNQQRKESTNFVINTSFSKSRTISQVNKYLARSR